MKREFRKYLGYAGGEILLVIAGILIALQIDTWYDNKVAQERLDEYLANIEHDIGDDLRRLTELKVARASAAFESRSLILTTAGLESEEPDWFNAAFVALASAALETAQQKHYFIANAGSYRALGSSGLLTELADAELESMLYDYYRTVERIGSIEDDINSTVRELSLQFQTEVGTGLDYFIRSEPLFLWSEYSGMSDAEERQARTLYWQLLTEPVTQSLLRNQINQSLFQEYEHLLSLGDTLVARLRGGADSTIPDIYSASSTVGHPILIEDGVPGYHSFGIFEAPPNGYDNFHVFPPYLEITRDALEVRYPGGDAWAYLYVLHGPIHPSVERFAKDYSSYDRIRLELKRDAATECADLVLEIKDVEDAEKGGLRSVPLNLTPEWATYTFDLSEFVEADLARLNVVAGFLFASPKPCSIAIADVRYLRPD